jgi:hypothetical protein
MHNDQYLSIAVALPVRMGIKTKIAALMLAAMTVLYVPHAQCQIQMQALQSPAQQDIQMGPVHETQSCEATRQAVILAYHCLATTAPSLSKTCDPLFARVAAMEKAERQATLQQAIAAERASAKAAQKATVKMHGDQRELAEPQTEKKQAALNGTGPQPVVSPLAAPPAPIRYCVETRLGPTPRPEPPKKFEQMVLSCDKRDPDAIECHCYGPENGTNVLPPWGTI